MKQAIFIMLVVMLSLSARAQNDTTVVKTDSINIGNMIIINNGRNSPPSNDSNYRREEEPVRRQKRSNVSSKDFVVDLGFANLIDKTDYTAAASQNYVVNKPGGNSLNANDFKLRQVKSSNLNIWFFMRRMNLINHYVNLKYGFGLEFNNYRFEKPITFKEGGPNPYNNSQNIDHPFAFQDSINFKKDKFSTDYVTVPLMLNFQSNPNYADKGISFSAGISMGYLYNARNKQISDQRGKRHNKGDYDNEKFKFSYIGELGLGKLRLYGSYSPTSIFNNGLDLRPYTIGIRFSKW